MTTALNLHLNPCKFRCLTKVLLCIIFVYFCVSFYFLDLEIYHLFMLLFTHLCIHLFIFYFCLFVYLFVCLSSIFDHRMQSLNSTQLSPSNPPPYHSPSNLFNGIVDHLCSKVSSYKGHYIPKQLWEKVVLPQSNHFNEQTNSLGIHTIQLSQNHFILKILAFILQNNVVDPSTC